MILIEKDFLSFGHQFQIRNGYYSDKDYKEDQNSPILLQYLDATHQLLVNYPMYFEFNMKFLVYIANNLNSGKYGTFLYNNERERDEKEARTKTMSIWTDILKNINEYTNPFYEKRTQEEYFFVPLFSSHKIRMWEEFFMQFTQLEVGLSYDRYINRWYKWKEGKVITQRERIVTNVQMAERDKEEAEKELNEKDDEINRLKECLMELVKKANEIFEEIDFNNDGNFSEFLTVNMKKEKICNEELLKQAFRVFDLDGNGYITIDELKETIPLEIQNNSQWIDIIKEVDQDGDCQISFDEFKIMMEKLSLL